MFEIMHAFVTWSGTGSVPFASSYRLTSSRNSFRRSSTSSILEPNLYVMNCTNCEGDGDVVGVVTPLRGVAQVVLHGVQVVGVGVRLRVHQDRGVEEDGEGQVEVEREEGEVKENHTCMKMGWHEDSRTS